MASGSILGNTEFIFGTSQMKIPIKKNQRGMPSICPLLPFFVDRQKTTNPIMLWFELLDLICTKAVDLAQKWNVNISQLLLILFFIHIIGRG